MLDQLDDIPWKRLRCLDGTAEHIPEAVRGLLSADRSTVERSYWRLENYVVAQGTVYEAGTYLPPILLKALDLAVHPFHVLNLLFQLGHGSAEDSEVTRDLHTQVVVGMEHWLQSSAGADPRLRLAVQEDLRELTNDA
jgi:hypothetical protein